MTLLVGCAAVVACVLAVRRRKRRSRVSATASPVVVTLTPNTGPRARSPKRGRQGNL